MANNSGHSAILLTTARLRLRPFCSKDVDVLVDLDSDPEVMRFISKGQPTSREVIESEVLPNWLELYRKPRPYGFWAVELLSSDAFIGWAHLRDDRISAPECELGYRFVRSAWDQGFATECSSALIARAFDARLCDFISARTLRSNVASQRVMQKCGLTFRGEFIYSPDLLRGWTEEERRAVKYGIARDGATSQS